MRVFLYRILAAGIGACVAIILAEGALRTFKLASVSGVATVNEAQYASIPGMLAPNQRLLDRRIPALPYWTTTDSLGYRGTSFPREKEANEIRILFIGDSTVFGDFVEDSETFPAVLEVELRARCQGRTPRVINAGLGGSTITEHSPILERALPLDLDQVILLFSENDVQDLARRPMWVSLAENRRAKSSFPVSMIYPVVRNTALWNVGLKARGKLSNLRVERSLPGTAAASAEDSVTLLLRERYTKELERLSASLAEQTVPAAFVTYPSHLTMTGIWSRNQIEWALETAEMTGWPAYDLSTALAEAGHHPETFYLLPHDGHPSPLGYRRAAGFLADQLMALPGFSAHCSQGVSAD
jgi:lysophospholipase L1-like esterase